jgi:DNA-directed RNA polymerase specialized sigma24 family protein
MAEDETFEKILDKIGDVKRSLDDLKMHVVILEYVIEELMKSPPRDLRPLAEDLLGHMMPVFVGELQNMLDTLKPHEAKVLKLYYGLDNQEALTLEEIGSVLGISHERARQTREEALSRLVRRLAGALRRAQSD